jgi:hypothetical protein
MKLILRIILTLNLILLIKSKECLLIINRTSVYRE